MQFYNMYNTDKGDAPIFSNFYANDEILACAKGYIYIYIYNIYI